MLKADGLHHFLKPMCGLTDSDDYWQTTLKNHLKNDLKMVPWTDALACLVHHLYGKLPGTIGIRVDDLTGMGKEGIFDLSKLTVKQFKSTPREYNNVAFECFRIYKQGKSYLLHKTLYESRPNELSLDYIFEQFRAQ